MSIETRFHKKSFKINRNNGEMTNDKNADGYTGEMRRSRENDKSGTDRPRRELIPEVTCCLAKNDW